MLDYPFWIRDGKELYPKDIDDDYLLNIINYMLMIIIKKK